MESKLKILAYRPLGKIKRINLDWLYGIDIIKELQKRHPEWNFFIVNGSYDGNIWENVTVLLRPNRHDGLSMMIVEARKYGIPYIWSYETGQYVEPNIDDIERRLIELEKNICRPNIQV